MAERTVGAEKAGIVRGAKGLTFLQAANPGHMVANAGHMVPLDQPEAALAMLNTFMSNAAF
ncbi:hypothetical protein T484DRAFT_1834189 [Baffinella frigidus]|nr:hypothetical protein T484DRAFT_1834189 [Cryptophyta sp. CCMP2293]